DGFMPLPGLIAFFESWAASFNPPVQENTNVSSLEADSDGHFVLSLPAGKLRARTVVVASGAYQKANRPAGAEALPTTIHQVFAEDYRNPNALAPGNVLIVGSGQTGCQLAEELQEAGRREFLSCGLCTCGARHIAGGVLLGSL